MAKEKKKLSKNAKLAAKILKDSKLFATVKNANDANSSQDIKIEGSTPKPSLANKMRPEKKRG
jgi:hypothetical protein